jgi:hypothetical protein
MVKKCKVKNCNRDAGFAKKGFCNFHYAQAYHARNKKIKKIRSKSDKQDEIDQQIYDLKTKLIEKMGMVCQGCGVKVFARKHVEYSHLIRRSQRPDLILSKRNATLHGKYCGCHDKWDSNDIDQMITLKDFWKSLCKIKNLDLGRYNDLVIKLDEKGLNCKNFKTVDFDRK